LLKWPGASLQFVFLAEADVTGRHILVTGVDSSFEERVLMFDLALNRAERLPDRAAINVTDVVYLAENPLRFAIIEGGATVKVFEEGESGHFEEATTVRHDRPVVLVRESPGRGAMITATSDGMVRLWDRAGHQLWQMPLGHELTGAGFDWGTRRLSAITGSSLAHWQLWKLADYQLADEMSSAAFPSGLGSMRRLIGDRVLLIRDSRIAVIAQDGRQESVVVGDFARAVAADREGAQIAVLTTKRELRLFALPDGQEKWRSSAPSLPLTSQGPSAIRFSHDGKSLAVFYMPLPLPNSDTKSRLWLYASADGNASGPFDAPAANRLLDLTRDNHLLLTDRTGRLFEWDPATRVSRDLYAAQATEERLITAVLSHDERFLLQAQMTKSSADGESGVKVRLREWPSLREIGASFQLGSASTLAFSGDDKYFAVTGSEGTIRIWDTVSGKELTRIQALDPPLELSFSKDSERVVALGRAGVSRYLWPLDELLRETCNRAERNLTSAEWQQYVPSQYGAEGKDYRCVCTAKPCK